MTCNGILPTTTYLKLIISIILSHKTNTLELFKNNQEVFQRYSYKFLNKKKTKVEKNFTVHLSLKTHL